ncbi:NTP transferase domain-containing protein [Methylorubrum salsuginis]|uniref:Phosphotransferase enzyme family protein n=1 Tax=Methylorubrum salsuginis TaxID=414703 RepID=A0A1I4MP97_9HYPH|nr:phosphotransferase [Methylorubrum salsuginis]SFM05084.1 Phosphotransferase enzyme family protein [Methylorubrum salsuginis]
MKLNSQITNPCKLSDIQYIIVQAGGFGTRLGRHTRNKPKCLISVNGRPIIYSLFDRFPSANFIVIIDHLADAFERYISLFPPRVPVITVRASEKGTAAGLKDAVLQLPSDDEPCLLVWGDLRLGDLPDAIIGDRLRLGLTSDFLCRWSWSAKTGLVEAASDEFGVMGVFGIPSRRILAGCPDGGEFVEWLAESNVPLDPFMVRDAVEIGTVASLAAQRRNSSPARYFNVVEISKHTVTKAARDPNFAHLIRDEVLWYKTVAGLGFTNIPTLLKEAPLTLTRVPGHHPFELSLDSAGQTRVLGNIIEALADLHRRDTQPGSAACTAQMYREKPLNRLEAVEQLIPKLTSCKKLQINGRICRNILHPSNKAWFNRLVDTLSTETFVPIHGDPTFSNILIDTTGKPLFIDPRGRFGDSPLHGDPRYDWAKVYYSVVGGYDFFNAKRFELRIGNNSIDVNIDNHGWGHLKPIIERYLDDDLVDVQIIHALIWLSLSGFAVDDYDSIIAAYALGLFYLEDSAR